MSAHLSIPPLRDICVQWDRGYLQRLFSTFANGWPGRGLVILRLTMAAFLIHSAAGLLANPADALHTVGAYCTGVVGVFLAAGLWTPLASVAAALIGIRLAYSSPEDFWPAAMATGIALALSVLGPGAWSIDSMKYGRRKVSIGD